MPLTLADLDFDTSLLRPHEPDRFLADVNALHDFKLHHDLLQLQLGDAFNQMKARWGTKMPALARQAGVSYHAARQRARVAAAFPPDSPLRSLGLPYSILRLLAPLPDPEPWAKHALVLQKAKLLRVRSFARILEDDGARSPRKPPPPPPHCAQCDRELPEYHPFRLSFTFGETKGWLCDSRCAAAYLQAQSKHPPVDHQPSTINHQPSPPDPSHPSDPSDPPVAAPRNRESQSRHPAPQPSNSAPSAARTAESHSWGRYRPYVTTRSRPSSAAGRRPGTPRRLPPSRRTGHPSPSARPRPGGRRGPPRSRASRHTGSRSRDPPQEWARRLGRPFERRVLGC